MTKPAHVIPMRPGKSAPARQEPSWAEYERRKQEWVRSNPSASNAIYTAAMRRIAKECGV